MILNKKSCLRERIGFEIYFLSHLYHNLFTIIFKNYLQIKKMSHITLEKGFKVAKIFTYYLNDT